MAHTEDSSGEIIATMAAGLSVVSKQNTHDKNSTNINQLRGFAKKKIQKIRVYYGSGWVGPGVTRNFFGGGRGKSSQNSSKPVLIFWSSIPCVFCLYIHC